MTEIKIGGLIWECKTMRTHKNQRITIDLFEQSSTPENIALLKGYEVAECPVEVIIRPINIS